MLISTFASPSLAAWPNQPTVNLPLCTAASDQEAPTIVADGAGGAIVTWQDFRSGADDIYAQHVLASGAVDPAWPVNGRGLCTATGEQQYPKIVADGAGGAIVAWFDSRSGSPDIYAQHVLASGAVDPVWPVNGRALCTAAGNQQDVTIVADGAGGAIVTWTDLRSGTTADIYAEHVLASGAVDLAWPVNGRALCTATNDQTGPTIVTDGVGGAIVTWNDRRSGTNWDIYAQHVLASGAVDPAWPSDGRALCTAANDQTGPTIVADGAGGAIVVWSDQRSGTNSDIYAQHVLASGAVDPTWLADGRPLCTAPNNQAYPTIITDGAGGAIVTWEDFRNGTDDDIYAQHVLTSGAVDPAWPVDGRALCTATNEQLLPTIVADGAGGAIVTWHDLRAGSNYDIYAQHVLASGAVDSAWLANGRALSTATNNQQYPTIISDGAGGAIATWQDLRNGSEDIYAQRVARFGYLGTPEAEIVSVRDVPNDQGGRVKLSWNASYLDLASDPNLSAYDVLRSVPPNIAALRLQRGAGATSIPNGPLPTGADRLFVTAASGKTYYWEYLASVNALHYLSGYSYLAPTAQDSTAASNPKTTFMVVARNASGSMFWPSRPDSGYSVDNLAPAAPTPFTGVYSGGSTYLNWGANSEPDLAGYRLYRGSSAGFVPGPSNLVASLLATSYVDPGAAGNYYKLSAVDIHGNEGGYSLLGPSGITAVPAGSAPAEVAFGLPYPNPALESVALGFVLPRAARITLAVYDGSGRRVTTLLAATVSVGEHTVEWNLRDDAGRPASAGLYFARLDVEGRTLVRRIATLR